MPIEQRVVSQPKIGGGKIGARGAAAPAEEPEPVKKSKKKLIIIVAAAVLLLGGGGGGYYFFVIAPKSSSASAASTPAPSPGAVVAIDAHSLNLADGHYLRLGLALQLTKAGGEGTDLETSAAVDAAVTVFSGHTVAEVQDATTREQLRADLLTKLQAIYGADDLMGVYFTDYVTQ